jgi:conjugal transfer pilus assembly protein TraB
VGERDEDDDSKVSKKGNDDNLVESVRGGQARKSSSFSLPMGSMLEGTLITGLDAPTASQAKQQPFPALFRVKHEALLPNRWRTDIRECFLIASGYGDLASERAYLRAEAISCVRDDGTMMESIMDAFATGEDGKNGLRGRLVSKQGAMIGQALMGGFIQGIANIYKPARVPQLSLTANQTDPYSRPSPELALQEGLGSGMQSAGKLVADYYIDLARHTFPIIEIDAGRKVTFIVARTANVATRKATGKSGMATPNQSMVGMPNTPVGNMINRMTN